MIHSYLPLSPNWTPPLLNVRIFGLEITFSFPMSTRTLMYRVIFSLLIDFPANPKNLRRPP